METVGNNGCKVTRGKSRSLSTELRACHAQLRILSNPLSSVAVLTQNREDHFHQHIPRPVASQDLIDLFSEPPQPTNYNEYAGNVNPEPWRFDQFDLQAYQNSQALGSLPLSFDGLTLSPNNHVGALEQMPTLGRVLEEEESGMGSDSEGLSAAVYSDRRHEDEVTMSGQQPQQERGWKVEVSESGEEEDDLSSEYSDGDDQDEEFEDDSSIGTGHLQTLQKSWIPWDSYTELIQLYNEDGNRVEVVGKVTTTKQYGEETVNGHRHHVMYRRNYFKVEGQYCLTTIGKKTGQLYVNLDGDIVPVEAVCATVRGVINGDLAKEMDISTFTTRRKKLDEGPLTFPLSPSNAEPVFEESTAGNGPNKLGTWLRMQWRRATENNGARRAKNSSNYNIVMRLMVQVRGRNSRRQRREAGSSPGTKLIDIGYCMSGPIQARGRCPKTFEKYDPTNVDHKRRRPNKDTPPKGLLAKRFDSKKRIGKAKKEDLKIKRQSKRRTTLLRTLTSSTAHTPLSRSSTYSATQTTVSTSPPRGQTPSAPMADFSAARSEIDTLSDEEMGDFQSEVLDEFGIAGEDRYQHPAPTPMWPSQRQPFTSEGNLLSEISAWATLPESNHPDAISDMDLNLVWH